MSRGFTLLELLVALALVAVTSAVLASALHLGLRTWRALEARARASQDVRLALEFVARQVEQAREISGEADALELRAPLPPQLGAGGLATVRFDAQGAGASRELVARVPRGQAMESVILVHNLQEARFAYRAAAPGEAWRARWDRDLGLPALVRLRLAPDPSTNATAREMVAAPRLAVDHASR